MKETEMRHQAKDAATDDCDALSCARLLIEMDGKNAGTEAARQAVKLLLEGEIKMGLAWLRVLEIVEEMLIRDTTPPTKHRQSDLETSLNIT
jgi:hypothetical protein